MDRRLAVFALAPPATGERAAWAHATSYRTPGPTAMRFFFLSLALLLSTAGAARAQSDAPTVILHGGDVFTADPDRPRGQALAVRGDRIVAVGSDAEVLALKGPGTTVLDLGGRLVVPGLNDAHIHIGPWPAMRSLGLSGPEDPGWAVALDSVRAAAASTPVGTWISGSVGGTVLDAEEATRFALDAVSPAHPVMLSGFTGHGLVVNTAALRALGLSETEPDRPGGWYGRVAGTDTLDGRLWEYAHLDAAFRLSAPFTRAEAVATYRQLSDRMLRWGVTSVQQMGNGRPIEETLTALAEADLPLRWGLFAWPMPARDVAEPRPPIARPAGLPDRIRVIGTKWMLDGTPIERLAALRAPYADRPGWSGRLNFSPEDLRTILRGALDGEGQTALHVAGDSTLALVLRTMAALAPADAWRARRLRIEHGDGTMPDLLPQMVDLGVVLVQNPLHLALPQFLHARYGEARTPHVQLLRSAAAAGVPVALGADAGGSGRNPWLNVMMATLHPSNPAEALSREQALVAYTRGGAYAEAMEHEKGTLAPGMLADLAVLSQDVLAVPPDALPATESVLTMVGGEIVHRDESFGSAAIPRPEAPLLNKIEHFYATSENAEGLFYVFRDALGLAQVWAFQPLGDFASGGVSLGNVAFELVRWTPEDGSVLPSEFSGIAFEPAEHTDALLVELGRRDVSHGAPEVNTWTNQSGRLVGWTNTPLYGAGMLPEPRSVFVCDYADRALVAANRRQASDALRAAGGGPLGVVALREITVGVTDLEEARTNWRRLIDGPAQERDDVFAFGAGPRVRLVSAAEPGIPQIVVEVRSLQQARAFLTERGWLSQGASGETAIAPEAIGGLRVLLVEP